MLKHISLGAPARMTDNRATKKHNGEEKKKKHSIPFGTIPLVASKRWQLALPDS